jgi:hypothetical protein
MARFPEFHSRRVARIYACIPITLLLGAEGFATEQEASTLDVSLQGARIVTQPSLIPGQTIEILSYLEGARPQRVRVVWVRLEPAGPTQAGLEFVD